MNADTASSVAANTLKKGDVLGAARFAAIQAAKSAASFLPLANSGPPRRTTVEFLLSDTAVDVEVIVVGRDAEGDDVTMPALSAATVATLTIYDMCKSVDRTMSIGPVRLAEQG